MNRLVKFVFKHSVNISLAYYPPLSQQIQSDRKALGTIGAILER